MVRLRVLTSGVLVCTGALLSGCKTVAVEQRLLGAGGASLSTIDGASPAQQAAFIQAQCGAGSRFSRVNPDGSLAYRTKGEVQNASQQEAWADGIATYAAGKGWRLDTAVPGAEECNKGNVPLRVADLLGVLQCGEAKACASAEVCANEAACPRSAPPAADGARDRQRAGFNLAEGLHCGQLNGAGIFAKLQFHFLINAAGAVVGSRDAGYASQKDCEDIVASAVGGAICAWTGDSHGIYAVDTARRLGGGQGWTRDRRDSCLAILSAARDGVVCSWTGSAMVPFNIQTGAIIGVSAQSRSIEVCNSKLTKIVNGRMCSWTEQSDYAVYDVATARQLDRHGHFADLQPCQTYLDSIPAAAVAEDGEPAAAEPAAAEPAVSPLATISLETSRPLNSFFQLWREGEQDPAVGYTLEPCHDRASRFHIVRNEAQRRDGQPLTGPKGEELRQLIERCRLDTFYSWGSKAKLDYMLGQIGPGVTTWPGAFRRMIDGRDAFSMLFMTQSPTGSFGYGQYSIRIKLRKNLTYRVLVPISGSTERYHFGEYCTQLVPESEWNSTVIVRFWDRDHGSGLDYVLCGPGPIASWSYGTQRHYDEIVKDARWIRSSEHNYRDFELYYKKNGVDQYFGFSLDSNPFNEGVLQRGMITALQQSRSDDGSGATIFFNPAFSRDDLGDHFATDFPIYYNER